MFDHTFEQTPWQALYQRFLCPGPASDGYPEAFRSRSQVFRAHDRTGALAGAGLVPAGTGQEAVAARTLADPDVAFVQARDVLHGCSMLTIRRE